MPRKKNRRKEMQAKRRAEEVAKAPKPKPNRRVGIIAHHHPAGLSMAALALMAGWDRDLIATGETVEIGEISAAPVEFT